MTREKGVVMEKRKETKAIPGVELFLLGAGGNISEMVC